MRTSCDSGEAITYNGINGKIWFDKKESKSEGKGFKEGQIVTMEIDVESGKVNWTVNSEMRGTIVSKMLKDG